MTELIIYYNTLITEWYTSQALLHIFKHGNEIT